MTVHNPTDSVHSCFHLATLPSLLQPGRHTHFPLHSQLCILLPLRTSLCVFPLSRLCAGPFWRLQNPSLRWLAELFPRAGG